MLVPEQLTAARRARLEDELFYDTLLRLGLADEDGIVAVLRQRLKLEVIDWAATPVSPEAAALLPRELCRRNRLLPVGLKNKRLLVAMADPSDLLKCDAISALTGLPVTPLITTGSALQERLQQLQGAGEIRGAVELPDELPEELPVKLPEELPAEGMAPGTAPPPALASVEGGEIDLVGLEEEGADDGADPKQLLAASENPSVVGLVNAMLSEAIRLGASDIHLEPRRRHLVVRHRLDGLLQPRLTVPLKLHPAVLSRLKIMAGLDIAQRRMPQDGRLAIRAGGREVDVRLSTMPTIDGEKAVLRVLDKSAAVRRLDQLGIEPEDREKLATLVRKPQGMLICTGPTGSGKTTLLYALLHSVLDEHRNFQTIEDPVEYFLDEVNQVPVRDKIGLSFASVLRATLRQDPDVLLVGEMRDRETADVAFKAAITGHLLLTTLHTNHAVAAVTRLLDLGLRPYLIASALEGVVAQRLVRKPCPHCRHETAPDPAALQLLGFSPESLAGAPVVAARGCERCNQSGYLGRVGIFEFLVCHDELRRLIAAGDCREADLLSAARAGGMRTLREDALLKLRRGLTTTEELLRVLGPATGRRRSCEQCGREHDSGFFYCPHCGTARPDFCGHCRYPLEAEWRACPACGAPKKTSKRSRPAASKEPAR